MGVGERGLSVTAPFKVHSNTLGLSVCDRSVHLASGKAC